MPRAHVLRETVAAALMLSAAAHAGAVYWVVSGEPLREAASTAGGSVAVEVVLVQGPDSQPERAKQDADDAPAADGAAVSDDPPHTTPGGDREAVPVAAAQHALPAPAAAEPSRRAPATVTAPPPPPPKPSFAGPPPRVARTDPAPPKADRSGGRAGGTAGRKTSGGPGSAQAAPLADNPAPGYPYAARLRGQQGRVLLRVEVLASGDAGAVAVGESSGFASLDRAAAEAVRRWRFRPARRNGEAVAATVEVPIRFALK